MRQSAGLSLAPGQAQHLTLFLYRLAGAADGDGIGLIHLQRKAVRHDQGIEEQMDTVAEFIINPRRQPRRTECPPALRSPLRSVLRSP